MGLQEKRTGTPILSVDRIYPQPPKTHEGLKGKTPAEAAGIDTERENKWANANSNATKDDRSLTA